jgi:hypothetical protein
MACKSTLVVEHDSNGKLVHWDLLCEGKCKDKRQECAKRRHREVRGLYYCACAEDNEEKEDDDHPACRFHVYELGIGPFTVKAKCAGRCGKDYKEPCRPLVVKEYKVLQPNKENELELDNLKIHTVRHIVCGCHSEII